MTTYHCVDYKKTGEENMASALLRAMYELT